MIIVKVLIIGIFSIKTILEDIFGKVLLVFVFLKEMEHNFVFKFFFVELFNQILLVWDQILKAISYKKMELQVDVHVVQYFFSSSKMIKTFKYFEYYLRIYYDVVVIFSYKQRGLPIIQQIHVLLQLCSWRFLNFSPGQYWGLQ